ncbi:MAG: GntR family transcriptional regulator [Pseudomonadota bacterium]
MQKMIPKAERRTSIDAVFEALHDDISSLKLVPGAKLSEAEIASQFGVSRQPVRDAFTRLENKGLLLIRPKKATVVRGFSMPEIAHARFVRVAIEIEVLRAGCAIWDEERDVRLQENLERQREVVAKGDGEAFHSLDYDFHKMICHMSGHPLAFKAIQECKRSVDRLCVLSLDRKDEAALLVKDHEEIAAALSERRADAAEKAARKHFARLDSTIDEIYAKHVEFFEET